MKKFHHEIAYFFLLTIEFLYVYLYQLISPFSLIPRDFLCNLYQELSFHPAVDSLYDLLNVSSSCAHHISFEESINKHQHRFHVNAAI